MRIFIISLFILAPALSVAQSGSSNRGQNWDFSIAVIYQDSLSVGGNGGSESPVPDTSTLDVDSDVGYGVNFTYNFNSKFALGVDLDFIKPNYTAVMVPENPLEQPIRIDHYMSQFNGRIKGTCNMIDGPFTPFVDFGYGWTNVDSNVADGPPSTGCYWHPWLGYVCNNYYSTFSTTETSWGGAVGLRYELRNSSYLKLSYNRWDLNSGGNTDNLALESARLEYGWTF